MQNLRTIVLEKAGLTEEHYAQLSRLIKTIHLENKEFLLLAGSTCTFIGFVEEGVLRSFVAKGGNEINLDFYLSNSFVSGYTSFLTQTPASGSIQALSRSTVQLISYTDYHHLL